MPTVYVALFLVSASTLLFEVSLTRLFSVSQGYHFAFLSVSIALLGFGASGTWRTLYPLVLEKDTDPESTTSRARLRRTLASIAALCAASTLLAYLALNYVPFDSYRIGWDSRQLVYLPMYYGALCLPFFFGGLYAGTVLSAGLGQPGTIYGANLLGSAAGALCFLVLLPLLGGPRTVLAACIAAEFAALFLTVPEDMAGYSRRASTSGQVPPQARIEQSPQWRLCLARAIPHTALLMFLVFWLVNPPAWLRLRLSPYKALSNLEQYAGSQVVSRAWNAYSRVDVVQSAAIHSAPGLSLAFDGSFPQQMGLLVDGGNLSPILCLERMEEREFLEHLATALPFRLRPKANVLVVGSGGGLDVWTALQNGAHSVAAQEANDLVVRAVRQVSDRCGPSVYDHPRVDLVREDVRSYLRQPPRLYDIVILALTDTYQPVFSGAYALSESFSYTQEAFRQYMDHLTDNGLLVVTRWLQTPPSEDLRAWVLLVEALEQAMHAPAQAQVVALRSWSTVTLIGSRAAFGPSELDVVRRFCTDNSFDTIYYPGMQPEEANRYNILATEIHQEAFKQVLSSQDREALLRDYAYDVRAPTDNRPYFLHFFKWAQLGRVLAGLGRTWQPFGGSGFLILALLLFLAIISSLVLILLPLWLGRRLGQKRLNHSGGGMRSMLYFAWIGLGFMLVEIPLIQRFTLYLGQPAYSFSLVLLSLLLFSGLGSLASPRLPWRVVLLSLVLVLAACALFLAPWLQLTIGWSLAGRLLVTVSTLAPIGLLLGVPMARGIRSLQEKAPERVPWAWAVNGCASVISSILAVLGAVSLGSMAILTTGAVAYALAWQEAGATCTGDSLTAA